MERVIRGGVFTLALLPFIWVSYAAVTGGLGPDPAESLMHVTGEWSLRLLALTLLVSPLRAWTGWSLLLKLRRMLGLYAFFYGCIHLLSFVQFYVGWTPAGLLEELAERPYITMGFMAWLLMLPLAITSNQAMIRRLGKKWKSLHQLAYFVILLAVLHFIWLVKADYLEPTIYAIIAVVLLLHRVGPMKRFSLKSSAASR